MNAAVVIGSKNFVDGTTTFRSATFAASGNGFITQDMSFKNTAGPWKHQSVALRVGSDLSVLYRLVFQRCVVLARKSLDNQNITITAQGRKDSNQNIDISIHAYNVTTAPDLIPLKNST
eukprot:Gb_04368 [translate_table: standard]